MRIEIAPALEADVAALVEAGRPEVVAEVSADGMSLEEAALGSLGLSEMAWTARAGGALLCMFGVAADDALSGYARVWLLSTTSVDQHKLSFYKASVAWVRHLGRRYHVLYTYVDVSYGRAVAWLERLGFRNEGIEYTGLGYAMYKMVRRED